MSSYLDPKYSFFTLINLYILELSSLPLICALVLSHLMPCRFLYWRIQQEADDEERFQSLKSLPMSPVLLLITIKHLQTVISHCSELWHKHLLKHLSHIIVITLCILLSLYSFWFWDSLNKILFIIFIQRTKHHILKGIKFIISLYLIDMIVSKFTFL